MLSLTEISNLFCLQIKELVLGVLWNVSSCDVNILKNVITTVFVRPIVIKITRIHSRC